MPIFCTSGQQVMIFPMAKNNDGAKGKHPHQKDIRGILEN